MRKIGVVYKNSTGAFLSALPSKTQRLKGYQTFSPRIDEAKVFYPYDIIPDEWHQILDSMDALTVEVSIKVRVLGEA